MNVYLICSVRNASAERKWETQKLVDIFEQKGHKVFFPTRDAPQDSETGYEIIMFEREAIKQCDEVWVFWDVESKGSHFDLGMAFALEKTIRFIGMVQPDRESKSYVKAIMEYINKKDSYEI